MEGDARGLWTSVQRCLLNMPEEGWPEYSKQFLYSHMTKNFVI